MLKFMKFIILGLAAISFGLSSSDNASFPIGFVDLPRALQTVETGRKAKSELEQSFEKKKRELKKEEETLKKLTEDFQANASLLSSKEKDKKQKELQERISKFSEKTQKSQLEIQQQERDLTQPIIADLKKVIADLAKKKNLRSVFDTNEAMTLYYQTQDEFTDEVIAAYNQSQKSETK